VDPAARLRSIADDLGLAGIGVCSVEPFDEVRRVMETRAAAGLHAGMSFTYTDPAAATDVRVSIPWAERLVVAAWPYVPGAGSPGEPVPGTGRVARFAERDHYRGLREGLRALARVLEEEGFLTQVLVDDNRLVDRAAAVRAGVGWWGRSTMVLAPGAGPWLLLGSVATDAPLPVDEPMLRNCGRCDACLPACPTGALTDGVLDARLCLAHVLQSPGGIPTDLRSAVGDRAYGCDDCLEACPPGQPATRRDGTRRGRIDLVGVLGSSDRMLRAEHAHWYVPRRDPRFIRRNALVALGNAGGEGVIGPAAGYLGHPDPLLRAHAAWAVGRLGGPFAAPALRRRLETERDPSVRDEIEAALGSLM
jgi:epoxyqueuosine reductase